MKAHRFDQYGPACGTRDGVNAADLDPPEVTCIRCKKSPPEYWRGQHYEYRGDQTLIVDGPPDPALPPHWQGIR